MMLIWADLYPQHCHLLTTLTLSKIHLFTENIRILPFYSLDDKVTWLSQTVVTFPKETSLSLSWRTRRCSLGAAFSLSLLTTSDFPFPEQFRPLNVLSHLKVVWLVRPWRVKGSRMVQNFKPDIPFLNFNSSFHIIIAKHDMLCTQFAVTSCKTIKRVTDYLLQQHQRLFDSINLRQFSKRAQITFEAVAYVSEYISESLFWNYSTNQVQY